MPNDEKFSEKVDMESREMADRTGCGCCIAARRRRSASSSCIYFVVAVAFFANAVIYGVSWSVGVFYDVFADEFDTGSGLTALMTSLNTAVFYGAGPISGALTNSFGHRLAATLGGILSALGLALSAFGTSVNYLIMTFGIITGFGFSLSYVPVMSLIALMLDESGNKRMIGLAYGVATTGVGVGSFLYPTLFRMLDDTYGWRGGFLVTAGIAAQLAVTGACLRPLFPSPAATKTDAETNDGYLKSVVVESAPSSPTSPAYFDVESDTVKLRDNRTVATKSYTSWWRELLRPDVFQSRSYVVLCIDNTTFSFGLSVVYVHLFSFAVGRQPDIDALDDNATTIADAVTSYTDENSAAMLLSIIGAANLLGRFVFGLLACIRPASTTGLFVTGFVICGIATFLCPLAADKTGYGGLAAFSAAFGVTSACMGPLTLTLIIQYLDAERVAIATGYIFVFDAIGQLLGAPAAGWLYDTVGQYTSSFYLAGGALLASGLLMLLPWRWQVTNQRRDVITVGVAARFDDDNEKSSTSNSASYDVVGRSEKSRQRTSTKCDACELEPIKPTDQVSPPTEC